MEAGDASSDDGSINERNQNCHHSSEKSSNVNVEDEAPRVGMTFNSEDEVTKYYLNYGQRVGFGISRISAKNGEDGKKYFTLACSRAGKYISNSKNLLMQNLITKTQCKARLNACVGFDGKVMVSRVWLEHNHELNPTKACCFKLGPDLKRRLELNDQAGIDGHENSTFGERRLRLESEDVEAIQNFFVRMQTQNSKFYHVMDVDDKNQLRNIFWADARSRAAHEYFGEVITFDTAYLTNKYVIPFASFLGVNHHGQSVLLGCALLSNQDTKTFTWLFRTWLECMSRRAPKAIITDQDRAIKNAVEVVFPKACHRWCLWHLMKKVPEQLGGLSDYESIKTVLHGVVYDSLSKNDFMTGWDKMIDDYNLQDNEWLRGIYDERHCWVPVYVIDTFWAGMSTTQRSESMNSFFDGYVNSRTTLKQFIEQYETAVRDKTEKEILADFGSFNTTITCVSHFGFESQFQKEYTNTKFKEFQEEVASMMYCNTYFERKEGLISIYSVAESKKVHEIIKDVTFIVSFNEEEFELRCACCLFEFKGIICRHMLCVLKLTGRTNSVPPRYVLSHWRKDLKRGLTLINCGFDHLTGNPELQRLNKMCDAFYEIASLDVNTDDDFLKVMNWIKNLKLSLSCKEKSAGKDNSVAYKDDRTVTPKQVTEVLDHVLARRRGRPPSRRGASKADQIVKKKLARKKIQKNNQKSKKDLCANKVHGSEGECLSTSQMTDGIGTQETLHVPCCPRVLDYNVSHSDLLEAQHQQNNQTQHNEMSQPPL